MELVLITKSNYAYSEIMQWNLKGRKAVMKHILLLLPDLCNITAETCRGKGCDNLY